MNAATPILPAGKSLDLLRDGFDDAALLAVRNAQVFRLLADADPAEPPTQASLAAELGLDKDNFRKRLVALVDAGFLTTANPPTLSKAGIAFLPRLAALAGEGIAASAEPTALHGEIEADPDNPRPFDDGDLVQTAALDGLRDSIVRKGLLNALVVEPSPTPGVRWRLIGGERRWRAIGKAIAWEELPGDYPIRITVREGLSPVDRAMLVMVDNEQRQDLHPLDRGRMFQALIDQGVDQDEIAAAAGRSRKHVQDMVNLWKKLPDEAKARMRLPEDDPNRLGVKAAIGLIREARPKPALDLTPKLTLLLMEVMDACVHRPSANADMAKSGWTDAFRLESGGALSTLVERRWLEQHTLGLPGMESRNPGFVRVAPAFRASPEFGAWLDETGYRGNRREALARARGAVIGDLSATGVAEGVYVTDWLNLPKTPEPAPTAPPSPHEETVSPPPQPTPAAAPTSTTTGDIFGEQLRQVAAEAAAEEAAKASGPQLSPVQRLALVELADKIARAGVHIPERGGWLAPVGDVWAAPDATTLMQTHQLVAFVQLTDHGRLARFTARGLEWLTAQGFYVSDEGFPTATIPLANERAAAGVKEPAAGLYATPWLNRPQPKVVPAAAPAIAAEPIVPAEAAEIAPPTTLQPAGPTVELTVEDETALDQAALDHLFAEVRARLEDTSGRPDRWSALGALALEADLRRSLEGGDVVGAAIALMGLLYRLGEDKAGELIAGGVQ